jgi:type II secretory pathway component PulM
MSQVLEDKIKQIQEKLQLLAKQHAAVKKENQSLKEALAEARLQFNEAADVAEALQHQLDAKKYSQAMMNPEEKKAFEKKINGYIKEIDKCIALLSV